MMVRVDKRSFHAHFMVLEMLWQSEWLEWLSRWGGWVRSERVNGISEGRTPKDKTREAVGRHHPHALHKKKRHVGPRKPGCANGCWHVIMKQVAGSDRITKLALALVRFSVYGHASKHPRHQLLASTERCCRRCDEGSRRRELRFAGGYFH